MRVKSEARRSSIAEAAMEIFLEKGYEATSMADISKRAGGSKATLYGYFSSKDELFAEVMDTRCSERFEKTFEALQFDGDLSSTLKSFGISLLLTQLAPDLLAIRRTAIAEGARSDVGKLFYQRGPRLGLQRLADFIAGQMAAGRMRRHDAWQATIHLMCLIEGDLPHRALLGVLGEPDPAEIEAHVNQAIDIYLYAYHPDAPLPR